MFGMASCHLCQSVQFRRSYFIIGFMPTNNSSQEITTFITQNLHTLHYIHPNKWNLNNLKLNVDHHI